MVAGYPSYALPVIDSVTLKLLHITDATNTRENVERAVVSAYQDVQYKLSEDLVLKPMGFGWEYMQRGDAVIVGRLMDKLEQVSLGCELLIAGFDWNGDGCIFSVVTPGTAKDHNMCGYEAIGTGAYSAQATLMHHSINQEMKLASVLYHVCESKFMAESAEGVGRQTHVKVAFGDAAMDSYELSGESIDGIRRAWELQGRPRVPPGLIEELEGGLRQHPARAKSAPLA